MLIIQQHVIDDDIFDIPFSFVQCPVHVLDELRVHSVLTAFHAKHHAPPNLLYPDVCSHHGMLFIHYCQLRSEDELAKEGCGSDMLHPVRPKKRSMCARPFPPFGGGVWGRDYDHACVNVQWRPLPTIEHKLLSRQKTFNMATWHLTLLLIIKNYASGGWGWLISVNHSRVSSSYNSPRRKTTMQYPQKAQVKQIILNSVAFEQ